MKSRVQKNQVLHDQLATDLESDVVNSDLSHFADRLNQIDSQFDTIKTNDNRSYDFSHARDNKEEFERTEEKAVQNFDTFESAYLKDFLDEVKEYNVKKGYRKVDDTQSNIIEELNISPEMVRPFNDEEIKSVLQQVDPELTDEIEIEDVEESIEATQIYRSDALVESTQSESTLEETIAMAIRDVDNEISESDEDDFVEEVILSKAEEPVVESSVNVLSESSLEGDLEDDDIMVFDDERFRKELLSQTQTLQHKIIDQERSLDEMNETMVRTNRLMNVVLSLLFIAIAVVVVLIWKSF